MAWLEHLLGPYPFDTFGTMIVDSESGMETQTMVTLGDTPYTVSPEVIVHELAHQWYGDQVTPNDWRDVWMNEGMAMYLQGDVGGRAARHPDRREAGPVGRCGEGAADRSRTPRRLLPRLLRRLRTSTSAPL